MQLLVKWYGARNAPGPQDFSPVQEWYLFLVVLFTLLGYDVEKLQLIQNNEKDQFTERNSPMVVPKKQKTSDSGSNDDWMYVINSIKSKNSQNFISDILGLTKFSNTHDTLSSKNAELKTTGRINCQAILFSYLPLILFSLHLLYEELKLDCVMSESLPLLAQLLYQLSTDLKFDTYAHHYFLDFPMLHYLKKTISQISETDLQKITTPNYISLKPPDIFKTLNNLLIGANVVPFPYVYHVNPRARNIVYLTTLVANENKTDKLEMDKFVKLIIPAGSRVDFQESRNKFDRDMPKKLQPPTIENIVLLYHEMGMLLSIHFICYLLSILLMTNVFNKIS